MDKFKSIYRPVLKPVRPGEKHSPPSKSSSDAPPRFNFSKKFAELMQAKEDADHPVDSGNAFRSAVELKGSNASQSPTIGTSEANETIATMSRIKNTGAEKSVPLTASEEQEQTLSESFKFCPQGLPRLNLHRDGLLIAPTNSIEAAPRTLDDPALDHSEPQDHLDDPFDDPDSFNDMLLAPESHESVCDDARESKNEAPRDSAPPPDQVSLQLQPTRLDKST